MIQLNPMRWMTSIATAALLMFSVCPAWAEINVPNTPLFQNSAGVAPNIIVTLDDSGSMSFAFSPDNQDGCGVSADCTKRRHKSAISNSLYYNPEIIYRLPKNADGDDFDIPSFSAAPKNGFRRSDTVNLNSGYRPTKYYDWRSSGNRPRDDYMDHYCSWRWVKGRLGLARWWLYKCDALYDDHLDLRGNFKYEKTRAYYYVVDPAVSGCDESENGRPTEAVLANNNCFKQYFVNPKKDRFVKPGESNRKESENFAIWYSYYRTRNLATISAASLAFGTLPDTSRMAWQALNGRKLNAHNNRMLGLFEGRHRENFYDWVFGLRANGGTPLHRAFRRAGNYLRNLGAYRNMLPEEGADPLDCRRSYHIMMTDGVWGGGLSVRNYDGGSWRLPDDEIYSPRSPYNDYYSNTLADLAFKYYMLDLQPDLEDHVPPYIVKTNRDQTTQYFDPRNDPSTWQNMSNYMVGLGLTAALKNTSPRLAWNGDTYGGSYADLLSGTINWPNSNDGDNNKISDLWHAAINSRGKFYSADRPDDLVAAFEDIVNTISARAGSGGGAGLAYDPGTREEGAAFHATFDVSWSGLLKARKIDENNKILDDAYWDASDRDHMPAPGARNIFTRNGQQSMALTPNACSGKLAAALNKDIDGNTDNLCKRRVRWLRGDALIDTASCSGGQVVFTTKSEYGFEPGEQVKVEGLYEKADNATEASGYTSTYTVNSSNGKTFRVDVPESITCADLPAAEGRGEPDENGKRKQTGRAYYPEFRDRARSVLGDIVGSTPVTVGPPEGLYEDLKTLAGADSYKAFKNSQQSRVPMVYFGANDGMLHGVRADTGKNCLDDPAQPDCSGAERLAYVPRGVYAQLTNLTSPEYQHRFYVDGLTGVGDAYRSGAWGTYLVGTLGAGGRSLFALDISHPAGFNEDDVLWEFTDSDLGLTFGEPQIAPISTSGWATLIGNGYRANTVALYVIDLFSGRIIDKLKPNTAGKDNGLATPYLLDSDGDGIADTAYAGDLNGNLWKFANNGGNWSIGNAGQALFTTPNGQPITAQPVAAIDPETDTPIVYFGTGSYFKAEDLIDATKQTFYAIRDTGTTVRRSELFGRKIEQLVKQGKLDYIITDNADYDADKRGWYIDLNLPGADNKVTPRVTIQATVRQFGDSGLLEDRIEFKVVQPTTNPCQQGGSSWQLALDLYTGGRLETSAFDVNGDGKFDENDLVGGVVPSGVSLVDADGNSIGIVLRKSKLRNPCPDSATNCRNISGAQQQIDDDLAVCEKRNCSYVLRDPNATTGSTGGISGSAAGTAVVCHCAQGGDTPPERIYWRQIMQRDVDELPIVAKLNIVR